MAILGLPMSEISLAVPSLCAPGPVHLAQTICPPMCGSTLALPSPLPTCRHFGVPAATTAPWSTWTATRATALTMATWMTSRRRSGLRPAWRQSASWRSATWWRGGSPAAAAACPPRWRVRARAWVAPGRLSPGHRSMVLLQGAVMHARMCHACPRLGLSAVSAHLPTLPALAPPAEELEDDELRPRRRRRLEEAQAGMDDDGELVSARLGGASLLQSCSPACRSGPGASAVCNTCATPSW